MSIPQIDPFMLCGVPGLRSMDYVGNGFIPQGASWLNDTITGIDLYKLGFGINPTIFFDSTALSSLCRGTYKNPYNTLNQVNSVLQGSLPGTVLGIKRGTFTRGTLNLTGIYGSASNPIFIVPYGNQSAMPVISGGSIITGWTNYSGDNTIWQKTQSGTFDVFENTGTSSIPVYNRLWGLSGTSLSNLIANIEAYKAAPISATLGCFGVYSGIVYIYLNDQSNPNLGQIEINLAANAVNISYPDNSNTGNINIAGISTIMSANCGINIVPTSNSNINSGSNINIVACQMSYIGSQPNSGNLLGNGILLNGTVTNANLTGSIIGNYAYDCTNNSQEINAANGLTVQNNIGFMCGGNSILECGSLTKNIIIENNRGYNDPLASQRLYVSNNHMSGIWLSNNAALDGSSQDTTKNSGRIVRNNYIQDGYNWAIDQAGQNDIIYNNTFVDFNVHNSGIYFDGGASGTGNYFFNNLSYCAINGNYKSFIKAGQNSSPIPTMNNNAYISTPQQGNYTRWFDGANQQGGITGWQSLTSQDSNSLSSDPFGGTITSSNMGISMGSTFLGANTDLIMSTGSIMHHAGSNISSYVPIWDINGCGYLTPTTPNIGCYQN